MTGVFVALLVAGGCALPAGAQTLRIGLA